MNLAREWSAFAGALFSLMGVSLVAGARRSAEDALSWERQWRSAVGAADPAREDEPRRRGIQIAYRLGGLFFTGVGIGLFIAAATGRGPYMTQGGGRDALSAGAFFTLCGSVLAFNAWLRRRRAPRFLEGELLAENAPLPLDERVAAFCHRAMVVLLLAFGVRLIREGLR